MDDLLSRYLTKSSDLYFHTSQKTELRRTDRLKITNCRVEKIIYVAAAH